MKTKTLAMMAVLIACQQLVHAEQAESTDMISNAPTTGVNWDIPMLKYRIPEGTNYYTYEFGLRDDGVVVWRKDESPAEQPQMAAANRVRFPAATPEPVIDDATPPGTQEFYDKYIRGKYRKERRPLFSASKLVPYDPESTKVRLEGVVAQIIDTNAIIVETSQILATGAKERKLQLVFLDSVNEFEPRQKFSLDVMRELPFIKCETASGGLIILQAYRPWKPDNGLSYEEYLDAFNQDLKDNQEIQIIRIATNEIETLNNSEERVSYAERRRKRLTSKTEPQPEPQPGTQEYYDRNILGKYYYKDGKMKEIRSYEYYEDYFSFEGKVEQFLPDGRIVIGEIERMPSGVQKMHYVVIAPLEAATNRNSDSVAYILDKQSRKEETITLSDGQKKWAVSFVEAPPAKSISFDEYMEVYRKESSQAQEADKANLTTEVSSGQKTEPRLSEEQKAEMLNYFNKHIKDNYMLIDGEMVDVRERFTIHGSIRGTVLQIIDSENVLCDAIAIGYLEDRELGKIVASISSTNGVKIGDELDLDVLPVGMIDCKLEDGTTQSFQHYSIPKNFITIDEYEPFYRAKLKKEAARKAPGLKIEGLISN